MECFAGVCVSYAAPELATVPTHLLKEGKKTHGNQESYLGKQNAADSLAHQDFGMGGY